MSKDWFAAIKGNKSGPYSREELLEQLRQGTLSPADYVWQPEFGGQWKKVQDVESLSPVEEKEPSVPDESAACEETPCEETSADAAAEPEACVADGNRPPLGVVASALFALRRTLSVFFTSATWHRWLGIGFCVWICAFSEYRMVAAEFVDMAKNVGTVNLAALTMDDSMASVNKLAEMLAKSFADGMVLAVEQMSNAQNLPKLAFVLLLSLWACWLRSRGDFMLVLRWFDPDATLRDGWSLNPFPSRTVFHWRLASSVVVLMLVAGCMGIIYPEIIRPYVENGHVMPAMSTISWYAQISLRAMPVVLFAAVILCFLTDNFIVPILFFDSDATIGQAWKTLGKVILRSPLRFIAFIAVWCLLQMLFVSIFTGLVQMLNGAVTYLFALPFIGSLIVTPVMYCMRGFAIKWLGEQMNHPGMKS